MRKLYIDFDGVILDTITPLYNMIEVEGIEPGDEEKIRNFYRHVDWFKLIEETPILNDSIGCMKKIMDTGKYDVEVLTHVNSTDEAIAKINFLHRYFDDISIIIVPKEISKTDVVHVKDAILIDDYAGNLRGWAAKGGIPVRFSQVLESKGFPVLNRLDEVLNMDL